MRCDILMNCGLVLIRWKAVISSKYTVTQWEVLLVRMSLLLAVEDRGSGRKCRIMMKSFGYDAMDPVDGPPRGIQIRSSWRSKPPKSVLRLRLKHLIGLRNATIRQLHTTLVWCRIASSSPSASGTPERSRAAITSMAGIYRYS